MRKNNVIWVVAIVFVFGIGAGIFLYIPYQHRRAQGDRLDVLVTLVQAYEARHYPMDFSDPIEAIKYAMEIKGLQPKDLTPMIGRTNRVYEVLSGRRPLTLAMIQRLHRDLGIPAESLIGSSIAAASH